MQTTDDAILAIYDCALAPEEWPDTLSVVTRCFDAAGTLLFFQRADGSYSTLHSPGVLDAASERFFADGWTSRDIRAIRAQEQGTFGKYAVVTDADVVSQHEMETHPYYTEFLGPHGLKWFMAASLSPDPAEFVVLSVQQYAAKPPFNEREKQLLERLAGHAERSLRLSRRLMRAELANVALGEALERLGCGVVLADISGEIVFANAAASDLSRALSGAMIGNGGAKGADPAFAELRDAMRQVSGAANAPETRAILLGTKDGKRTVAHVLPAGTGTRDLLVESFGDVRAIVIVLDQRETEPVDPALVRDLLGVTLGEARVASLVGAGRSPREAADMLGITEETARTVLKRVFAKVNVSKQSQLAVLLMQLSLRPG